MSTPGGAAASTNRATRAVAHPDLIGWARVVLLVGVAYYGGAKLGFALTFQPRPVSTFWAPNAILLAAFLLTPVRVWWLLLLGALPAHLLVELGAGVPLPMVLCWFVSNATEGLLGAAGVRWFAQTPIRFDRAATVGLYLLIGAVLAPCLSSFLDAAFVRLNGWGGSAYWAVWGNRLFSNVLASLAVVPFIVAWSAGGVAAVKTASIPRIAEAAVLAGGLLIVTLIAFGRQPAGPGSMPVLLYTPLPFLLWAAVRFGPKGTSTGLLLVILLATWNTVHGRGPFVAASPEANALAVQLLFIIVAMTLLSFTAVIAERARAEETARRRGELLEADIAERKRAEALSEGENAVLELIARGAPLTEILERLVAFIESEAPGAACSILLLDPDGIHVRHGAAPSLPAAYVRAIDGMAIGPRAGSCGTAIYTKKAIVTRDIQEDPLWTDFRELAARHDLRACWSIPILSRQGDVLGSFAIYHDQPREPHATERGMTEIATQLASIAIERQRGEVEAARQRTELAHLGRAVMLSQLSGTLAHELRQPLAAILSDAQAAQRMLASSSDADPELAAILDDIVAANTRARDVIDRVRVMLVKGKSEQIVFRLADVVQQTLELVRADLLMREVRVELEAADDVPAVRGDRVQLQQVILNLVMNACEAMSGKAPPERLLRLVVRPAGGQTVELRVEDHGSGIPLHLLEHIFEPFVTSKRGGLGLGLSICRSIVRAHGGRLWAVNGIDCGATFHLVLPSAARDAARTGRPAEDALQIV